MIAAERLVATDLTLGEGPIRRGEFGFACVDIRGHAILEGSLDGAVSETARFDTTVSAIAETDQGPLLAAVGRHIEVIGSDLKVALPDSDNDIRLNDGKADPAGRFICGTMADPVREQAGALWSFSAGAVSMLIDNVSISNGLAWSANGETMYFIDTPTQRVDALDYDLTTGRVANRRTVVDIDQAHGSPDGMTLDTEGGLWIALWGGSAVHRYLDGTLDEVIELPTPHVTCPVFVGRDHDQLLVTTASEPNPGEPGAGDLYLATPGVIGQPANLADVAVVFGKNPPR